MKLLSTTHELPKEFSCPDCGGGLTRTSMMLAGPYSGHVSCECGYQESAYSFIAKKVFTVEPLPDEES